MTNTSVISIEDSTASQSAISIEDSTIVDDIELPEDFVAEFNFAAFKNSEDGKETGGFICGDKETLSATTLFIPKQRGYDTYFACEYGGEAECWKYMEDRKLTILGFIHTHPTFSAFLSSIDLHMAFQIQKDIPGAIAIVVSTRDGTEPNL